MDTYYAERIYVLIHRCHEQCLKLVRINGKKENDFSETGINTRHGIILKLLLAENGMTQKELTWRLGITSSSCGELITKLEHGGHLEKRKSPTDKRTYNLSLTESGHRLAEHYKEKYVVELEEWATDLTQQEKSLLYQLLGKLSKGLEDQIQKISDDATE